MDHSLISKGGEMKKFYIRFSLLVISMFVLGVWFGYLIIRPEETDHVHQPTHFVCTNAGSVIVDTTTVNGAEYGLLKEHWTDPGIDKVAGWTWDDVDGHHTLSFAPSVACEETIQEEN